MAKFVARARKLGTAPPTPLSKMSPTATTAPRAAAAPTRPQPAVVPTQRPQPYGPSMAEIQKQLLIQQQQALAQPQFTPQQLAELQKQNLSPIQPAPTNLPSKPATSVSKQSPNLSPYNASKQPTMSQADAFNQRDAIGQQLSSLETQAQMTRANASKMPAMRKGGVVKKKPVAAAKKTTAAKYAKGGMVMSNCGASMKPQQKRK